MMPRRLLLFVSAATVAAALTTTAVIVVADPGGPEKAFQLPEQALKAEQIVETPAGIPVSSLTLPYTAGQLRILPAGSVPHVAGVPLPRPDAQQVDVEKRNGATLDECRIHALFAEFTFISPGWQFAGCFMETVVWDDGSKTDSVFVAFFQNPGRYPITIGRALRGDGTVDIVDDGGSNFSLTLSNISGVPAVIRHKSPGGQLNGPFTITLVKDGVVTEIEGTGVEIGNLLSIAESMKAHVAGGTP